MSALGNVEPVVGQRWGRDRSNPGRDAASAARDGAVAAFLDADTRQRHLADLIAAVGVLDPRSSLISRWSTVSQTYFDASAQFVTVSASFDLDADPRGRSDFPGATTAYIDAHRALAAAAAVLDEFYDRHRAALEDAGSAVAAIPRLAEQAVGQVIQVRKELDRRPEIGGYPSVVRYRKSLDRVAIDLDQALAGNALPTVRSVSEQIFALAAELRAVVEAAHGASDRARTALASVRTRLDVVGNRIERLPVVRSALLRDYSEPNSADLLGNPDRAERDLEAGRSSWEAAQEAMAAGDPERALEALTAARRSLTEATAAADALLHRHDELDQVRADRLAAAKRVRFRIRDAQRLVVDHGLIPEWGSVLDAQSRRVEVAQGRLVGAHPDYWAYLTELASIESFVAGVVERVRDQLEKAGPNARPSRSDRG